MALPRLRAPRQDRAVLVEPPLADVAALLARNRRQLGRAPGTLLGKPWTELRRQARQAAATAAADYLRQAGEPIPAIAADSLLMAGHQPELFHPGVWVKNFALCGLARQHGATALNLVVDNDVARATGLHVPFAASPPGSAAYQDNPAVRLASVPFDRGTAEEPYEERTVHDEALFADFPDRVADALQAWNLEPLLPAFWDEVQRQAGRTPLLGERFAAARRTWERRWGCHNLEVPVSLLCRTEPFAWFACHLLADLPRFHSAYNACVHDYRRRHGLRSRHHPVPDLATEGDWLEVPLWAWRAGQKRRSRLFARLTDRSVELRVAGEEWPALPRPMPSDPAPALAAWLALEGQGFKVRSRALTNTLYARLFLADLFIHGIGGGKYDEVTDAIVRRFYGFDPPGYLVLSATLLLPLPAFGVSRDDRQRLAHALRDLHYNPQRHLGRLAAHAPEQALLDLAALKRAWMERQPADRQGRRERFRVLRSLTEKLRSFVGEREEELWQELTRTDAHLQADAVLRRRDYAFCLFPEALLRPFCTQFL